MAKIDFISFMMIYIPIFVLILIIKSILENIKK